MKLLITPLIVGLLLLYPTPDAEARTYNLYGGAAKITLPKGAKLERYNITGSSSKGYQVIFSKSDSANRAYIVRKSLRRTVSETSWRNNVIKYYNNLFRKEKGFRKNQMRGSRGQVIVDYQYKQGRMQSRDYTKYIRANSTNEVQAYYYTLNLKSWNTAKARQLRTVVNSLKPGR